VSYKVGPEDVVVVDRDGKRVPPPEPRGLHAKLRQRRVLLAAGLAAIEFLAVAFWHADLLVLVLFALLAVTAYWFAGVSCRPVRAREAPGSSRSRKACWRSWRGDPGHGVLRVPDCRRRCSCC
jgi:hypothetical protein